VRTTRRRSSGGVALVLAALAIALAGCGSAETRPAPAPPALVTETAGRGVQQSTIVRPSDRSGPLPVVVFLHGWGAPDPGFYRPWLEHLARRGNAVVYPRYQDSFVEPPRQALGNVLAAVRIALARPGLSADGLVVAGHSAGGALAADYAALARTAGLPAPAAVFAVYPGRRLPRIPRGLPEIPPRLIGAGTRIEALASRSDGVVGTATARALVRGARRADARLVLVRDPAVGDHQAPLRSEEAARRAFWAPLDELIAAVR
jgi:pimeloyl-ACP methyl ester carboxylesterase